VNICSPGGNTDLEKLTWGKHDTKFFERQVEYGKLSDRYIAHIDRFILLVDGACRASNDFKLYMIEASYQKHPVSGLANPRNTFLKLADLLVTDNEDGFEAMTNHKGISGEDWGERVNEILNEDRTNGFVDYFIEFELHFRAKLHMKEAASEAPAVRDWSPSLEQLSDEAGDYESYGIVQITLKNKASEEDYEAWTVTIASVYNIWYEHIDGIDDKNKEIAQANSKLLKAFLDQINKVCVVHLGEPKNITWPVLKDPSELAPAFKEIINEDLKKFPDALDEQQGHLLRGD
jgi:hypothetical protein